MWASLYIIKEFSATSVCIKRTIMSVGLYNGVESYMCLHRERLSVGESCIKDFCATSVYIRRHIVCWQVLEGVKCYKSLGKSCSMDLRARSVYKERCECRQVLYNGVEELQCCVIVSSYS